MWVYNFIMISHFNRDFHGLTIVTLDRSNVLSSQYFLQKICQPICYNLSILKVFRPLCIKFLTYNVLMIFRPKKNDQRRYKD